MVSVSILSRIILRLIVGYIASRLMGAGGYGLIGDIVVGILGAYLGGRLAKPLLGLDVTGVNLTSILVGIAGAVVLIVIFRAIMPKRRRLFR
jgi:uncharacterized membrane protein YeaQ/YmgE (transglycosylase-associated protein family)